MANNKRLRAIAPSVWTDRPRRPDELLIDAERAEKARRIKLMERRVCDQHAYIAARATAARVAASAASSSRSIPTSIPTSGSARGAKPSLMTIGGASTTKGGASGDGGVLRMEGVMRISKFTVELLAFHGDRDASHALKEHRLCPGLCRFWSGWGGEVHVFGEGRS